MTLVTPLSVLILLLILRIKVFPFLEDIELVNLILYGNEKLKLEDNQKVLIATINFIRKTSRFTQN